MKQPKPVFRRENLSYEREEKEGYYTFVSKHHPETMEMVINETGRKILEYCNGENTLEGIVDAILRDYPDADQGRVRNDVFQTVAKYSRLAIVEWIGDNPFLYRRTEPISNDISMAVAQENDICAIREFINRTVNNGKASGSKNGSFFYTSPYSRPNEYNELYLRQKLFSYTEEFFLLLDKDTIVGLISVGTPILIDSVATVRLIMCPEAYFEHLLKYAHDNFLFLTVQDSTKIRMPVPESRSLPAKLLDALRKVGYEEEAVLKNEFGFGKDIRLLSWTYEKSFVNKVQKLKQSAREN